MTAHQSARGTAVETMPQRAEDATARNLFCYKPLNPKVDSTRFVKVLPATADDAILRCELLEIAFKDRPAYETLSYTSNSNENTQRIEVSGGFLEIGQNLFDALRFLRKRRCGDLYWIDALCINQHDVVERNRQLGMMGQTYFRSSRVIVWLGVRYLKYQDKLLVSQFKAADSATSYLDTSLEVEAHDEVSPPEPIEHSEQRQLVKELCTDPYWKHLWIIQQIGQARRLSVCFGSLEIGWDEFIHLVTTHQKDDGGPIKLHGLRQDRDHDGYSLKKLLYDHQDAKCKDPKDKIYGLVGLAGDAYGFPMDYERSLIQIWTDTMEFVNRRGLVKDTDLIDFGRLVKSLLMGDQCDPWSQIARPNAYNDGQISQLIDDSTTPNSPKVFEIKASVFGCIENLGPSAYEIVADLSKEKEWGERTQHLYKEQMGSARRESTMLMREILDSNPDQVSRLCHSHVSSVMWKLNYLDYCPGHAIDSYVRRNPLAQDRLPTTISSNPDDSSTPRLYQIHNHFTKDTQWKMGVASVKAQRGDLLCSINGLKKAVVVRVSKSPEIHQTHFRIYGTARVTEHMSESPQPTRGFSPNHTEEMTLKMDARTLFVLLA